MAAPAVAPANAAWTLRCRIALPNAAMRSVRDPNSQYPFPSAVLAIAATLTGGRAPPSEPWKRASPKVNTPPSDATSQ